MKYYRMKIDKQGKTQKKQSKKNYRKTQKGGLMEFLRGKSHRGEVENIIHQLHKIIKYKEDKDTKKAAVHMQRFKDAFGKLEPKVKEYIKIIFDKTEDLQNVQGSHIIEGEVFATTELLEIIHGEMTEKSKKKSTFDSDKNHMFEYVDDGDKFSSNLVNRGLIATTIQSQKDNDVIAVIKGEIESSQAAQGGKKTQKKRKRKRKKRKTASKK